VGDVSANEASLLRLRRLSDALQEYLAKRGALSEVRDGVGEGAESAVSAAQISTLDGRAPRGVTPNSAVMLR
jgi:hypothetical protein